MKRLTMVGLLAVLSLQWGCSSSSSSPITPSGTGTPSTSYTYPFDFFIGDYGKAGTANGLFQGPLQITIFNNSLFAVDTGNRIEKFDLNGNFLQSTTIGTASFLWGITAYQGTLYVGDYATGSVYPLDLNLNPKGTYTPSITPSTPTDMAVDGTGRIYFGNIGNNTLERCNNNGTGCVTVGGTGTAVGNLSSPYGVGVDGSGNVYVAEQGNNRVQKFNPSLASPSVIINPGTASGSVTETVALGVDNDGNILVFDTPTSVGRVQKFTPSGSYITTISAPSGFPFSPSNVIAFTFDSNKDFYASDYIHSVIFKFTPN